MVMFEINSQKLRLWAVIVAVQAASFGMGMYTAKTYWVKPVQNQIQLDYSTEQAKSQNANINDEPKPTVNPVDSINLDPANCSAIKGNVSGNNKTYHVPGGSFYDRTTPEMCFSTEAEAQAAGFNKSSR